MPLGEKGDVGSWVVNFSSHQPVKLRSTLQYLVEGGFGVSHFLNGNGDFARDADILDDMTGGVT